MRRMLGACLHLAASHWPQGPSLCLFGCSPSEQGEGGGDQIAEADGIGESGREPDRSLAGERGSIRISNSGNNGLEDDPIGAFCFTAEENGTAKLDAAELSGSGISCAGLSSKDRFCSEEATKTANEVEGPVMAQTKANRNSKRQEHE